MSTCPLDFSVVGPAIMRWREVNTFQEAERVFLIDAAQMCISRTLPNVQIGIGQYRRKKTEVLVWERVKNIIEDSETLDRGLKRMAERRRNEVEPKRQRLSAVETELEKAERKVKRLVTAREDEEDEYLAAELKSSFKMANKQREALAGEREPLLDDIRDVEISPEKIEMIRARMR